MRIVLCLSGLTAFIATKGDHGITQSINIPIVPGVPFEVPDQLAIARIKASPNLFRESNDQDEIYAAEFKTKKIAELNELVQAKQIELKEIKKGTEIPADEFDPADWVLKNEPLDVDKLLELGRTELFAVAEIVEIEFPKNIATQKLIQLIIDKAS